MEGDQGLVPESIEMGSQGADPIGVQLVETPLPVRAVDDQAGLLEYPQMLRHRRATDRELPGQFPDPTGTVSEAFEDGPPSGISQGVELSMVVSTHLLVSYYLPVCPRQQRVLETTGHHAAVMLDSSPGWVPRTPDVVANHYQRGASLKEKNLPPAGEEAPEMS